MVLALPAGVLIGNKDQFPMVKIFSDKRGKVSIYLIVLVVFWFQCWSIANTLELEMKMARPDVCVCTRIASRGHSRI